MLAGQRRASRLPLQRHAFSGASFSASPWLLSLLLLTTARLARVVEAERILLQRRTSERGKVVPAGWFHAFTKDESTFDSGSIGDSAYNPELEPSRVSEEGNTANLAAQENPPYFPDVGVEADWFEESPSAAWYEAWRTRFPPLEAFRNEGMKTIPWLPDQAARRKQTHLPAAVTSVARAFDFTKKKDAPWFDDFIRHEDDFGRNRPPRENSEAFYWDWERKTWDVSFACPEIGCTATTSFKGVKATDGSGLTMDTMVDTMQHKQCRLSVGVHATDYDDEYSREYVEWFKFSGAVIGTHCDPMAKGCTETEPNEGRGIHSCIADLDIDNLLTRMANTDEHLNLAGKNSEMVDECPINNNLLSGLAQVTCLVAPWPRPRATPPPTQPPDEECKQVGLLQCVEPGCEASVQVEPCREPLENEKCFMDVKIWQTDYDGDHGSKEVVEWIKVGDDAETTVIEDVVPKRKPPRSPHDGNPCKEHMLLGMPPTQESLDKVNGVTTTPEPNEFLSLDAQSRAILAGLPEGATRITENCRRRAIKELARGTFLSEDDSDVNDNSKKLKKKFPRDYEWHMKKNIHNITHLRAADDELIEVVTNKEVTDAVKSPNGLMVHGKISDMVDECGKDGWLFYAEVHLQCRPA